MKHIDKINSPFRAEGLKYNREILKGQWSVDEGRYFNLNYKDIPSKTSLYGPIFAEQEGLCCYCMRRLRLEIPSNFTLEHIVPNKITGVEWERDKAKYKQYHNLQPQNITVCPKDAPLDRTVAFGMPPFPHFIAYDNLVGSCDGRTLTKEGKEIGQQCCNNYRGNVYIEPLYLRTGVAEEIDYDNQGRVICAEEYVASLDKNGVNIMSPFLNSVRRFWRMIEESEYSVEDVMNAKEDAGLRQNIIDDIFVADTSEAFLAEDYAWDRYAEFDWFYEFYHAKRMTQD